MAEIEPSFWLQFVEGDPFSDEEDSIPPPEFEDFLSDEMLSRSSDSSTEDTDIENESRTGGVEENEHTMVQAGQQEELTAGENETEQGTKERANGSEEGEERMEEREEQAVEFEERIDETAGSRGTDEAQHDSMEAAQENSHRIVTDVSTADSSQSDNLATRKWCEYKIVGDNIDKNVRPSFQRLDRTTQSLHYFHSYSVLDRIDHSTLSNAKPDLGKIDTASLLPSAGDITKVKHDFAVLVSRYYDYNYATHIAIIIIVVHGLKIGFWCNMSEFSSQAKTVEWHIPCKYDAEMAKKSKVVSCPL